MKLEIFRDHKAILHSRCTPLVLSILDSLEGRRSWKEYGKQLHFEATGHNLEIMRQLRPQIVDHNQIEKTEYKINFEYKSKTKALPHKSEARAKMADKKIFALFLEQGTGKTWIAQDWAGELYAKGLITGMLVISKKGAHRQWIESELPDHFGSSWRGCFWPIKAFPKGFDAGPELKVFAINWDGLKTVKGFETVLKFCKEHSGKLLIVADESQEIKNVQSKRFKAAQNLIYHSSHRCILTGTPIAKDLTDEWSQFKWLEERIIGIKYATTFRREFCIMGGFEGRQVIGHRNLDKFKELTEPYIFRVRKEDIGILPKLYNRWTFDLTNEQTKMIKEIKRELETEINNGAIVSVVNAVSAMGKIHQIANGFVIDEEKNSHLIMPIEKNPRINAMLEWLETKEDRKVIIWHRFKKDAELIKEALDKKGYSYNQYIGSDTARENAKLCFLSPTGKQIFLANPQSAGTGLNLQGLCHDVLYYSNSYNSIDRWQSEDRNHRIGTKSPCVYTDLVAVPSLDLAQLSNLKKKKGLSQLVLGDIQKMLGQIE